MIEMATGQPPYSQISDIMAAMFHIVTAEDLPIPDTLSPQGQDFVRLCMQRYVFLVLYGDLSEPEFDSNVLFVATPIAAQPYPSCSSIRLFRIPCTYPLCVSVAQRSLVYFFSLRVLQGRGNHGFQLRQQR